MGIPETPIPDAYRRDDHTVHLRRIPPLDVALVRAAGLDPAHILATRLFIVRHIITDDDAVDR